MAGFLARGPLAVAAHYLVKADGSGDYATIQAAIDASTSGDTIVLDAGRFTGALNKNLDTKGKAILITAAEGADTCIIDCELDGRAFNIHSGESSSTVIRGIEVTNGRAATLNDKGGAIYCIDSSPTIQECYFFQNCGRHGGAIYLERSR